MPGAFEPDSGEPRGFEPGSPRSASAVLAALHPGRRALKPLAAGAVLIALIAGFVAWRSRPTTEILTPSTSKPSALVVIAPSPVPSSPTRLVVAVAGRVHHPGLVRLAVGSRVADAIQAAGGALPGTDLSFVNLARKVADGELIVIGLAATPGGSDPGGVPAGPGVPADGIVDVNTATVADLDTLPGIGPALAQRILDYRTRHGGFRSIEELRDVAGIGDAKFSEIKDRVTV